MKFRSYAIAASLALLLVPLTISGQGRKIRKIERPSETKAVVTDAPLPSDDQCRAAVYAAAAHYGPREIESVLHPEFPNREDLLEAIRRADLRVSNVRLEVESIERVQFEPWQSATDLDRRAAARTTAAGPALQTVTSPRPPPRAAPQQARTGSVTLATDCVADVRTRLVFEDTQTGQRTVKPAGRGEWRLRFAR